MSQNPSKKLLRLQIFALEAVNFTIPHLSYIYLEEGKNQFWARPKKEMIYNRLESPILRILIKEVLALISRNL